MVTMQGKKLDAAADMLRILHTYIENYIPDIEVWPLTQVVSELSKIALGGEAEFIKPKEKKPGQPIDPMYNLQQASLIAAIEILKKMVSNYPTRSFTLRIVVGLLKATRTTPQRLWSRDKMGRVGRLCVRTVPH